MTAGLDEATAAAIERACAHVVLGSIRAFDERDWSAYADFFIPEGVFIRANQPDQPLAGREAIHRALAARPASRLTRHLCTNLDIEALDAEHARGLCYLVLYVGDASEPDSRATRSADGKQKVGEYHDTFVLSGEGWRISRREGRIIFG